MQSERKINEDINQGDCDWIQVTLSGPGAGELTEAQIEAALSAAEPSVAVKALDDHTMQKLREALRFSASRSVMSSADEQRILSALTAQVQDVVCETCNGTGKEARHQICRDCDDGWQLAPMEPSDDMIAAAKATTSAALTRSHAAEIYCSMLAAAPAKQEGNP